MHHHDPADTLVLFDIDGTLMITGGAGSRAIHRACRTLFGEQFEWAPVTVGRLDPQLFADLARHNGIDDPQSHHAAYYEQYLDALRAELAAAGAAGQIKLMPGIAALLDRLAARSDVALGIVSGNYHAAAMLKLEAAGLQPARFEHCAFAEDGRARPDLVRAAIERCEQATGHAIRPGRVIVVGDTPRDIDAAHAHQCRSLAVATGRYDVAHLRQAGADRVAPDLADPTPLLAMLDELADSTD
jgi:phosphoglycolate phosphatase-like HAD superfamily hydrolase